MISSLAHQSLATLGSKLFPERSLGEEGQSRFLVSVITPCLNPGARLERCLSSVANQTYPAVEHIVVDGGSTDGSVRTLRAARGLRWLSEPDRGQTHAINKGISIATGSVLTWLNADDELLPAAIARVEEVFRENPAAAWVYGNCELRTATGTTLLKPPSTLSPAVFDGGNVIAQPGTFIRTEVMKTVGLLDERFDLAMDFELWLRLLRSGAPPYYVPHTLARFEVHPNSKTGRVDPIEFVMEERRALIKNERVGAAAVALGRAAARSPTFDGLSRRSLKFAITQVSKDRAIRRPVGSRVWAGALLEAAMLKIGTPKHSVRFLLAVSPWRFRATRRASWQLLKSHLLDSFRLR